MLNSFTTKKIPNKTTNKATNSTQYSRKIRFTRFFSQISFRLMISL